MMRAIRTIITFAPCWTRGWAIAVICAAVCGRAMPAQEEGAEDGFWPTPHMVELLCARIVDDMALRYGFDERQRATCRDLIEKTLPSLLKRHQETLQPVVTDIVVQHLSGEIPKPEQVEGWAKAILPAAGEAFAGYGRLYETMLPGLRPPQRKKWVQDHFYAKLGWSLAEAKLKSFAQGRFDPREWHRTMPGPHQSEKELLAEAQASGMSTPPPPGIWDGLAGAVGFGGSGASATEGADAAAGARGPSGESYVPLDEWERYLKQFIGRFHLDGGQTASAMAILKDVRQRARAYRASHSKDLDRVRRALGKARPEGKSDLDAELQQLERPLHDLFDEFRSRLNGLLTDSQRRLTEAGR